MRTILFKLFLACICFISCQTSKQDSDIQLKVLSWNIWHGGHSKSYPESGCEGVIGIIKHSEADVVIMIETYGASDKVADSLGFYHRLLSSNLSIYSRYPIIETYTFPDSISTFNFGGVMIKMNEKKVRLFNTWLHYLPDASLVPVDMPEVDIIAWENEGSRDDEIRKIISVLQPFIKESDSIPIIIGGDFNSHSHLDWNEKGKSIRYHNDAVINWTISTVMQKNGFIDSFREIHPNPVENIGTTWMYVEDRSDNTARIDYIYYQGRNIKTMNSESYNALLGDSLEYIGKKFFYASDHGFVESTFRLLKN